MPFSTISSTKPGHITPVSAFAAGNAGPSRSGHQDSRIRCASYLSIAIGGVMTVTDGTLGRGAADPVSDAEDFATMAKSAGRPRKTPIRAASVLYMLTPQTRMSPFDVNMAVDAGYKFITCYDGVAIPDVSGIVQDA